MKSQEDDILESGLIHKKPYLLKWNRKDIIIYPNVFSPKYAHSSLFLANFILKQNFRGKRILDVGTGSGLLAIASAMAKAREIIAIDINENAVKNTLENVENLKLKDKIKVKKSDLYENVRGKFDIIIANLAFIAKKPKDLLWKSVYDYNYKTLRKFFSNVKNYLKKDGKIIFAFGNVGDVKFLKGVIEKNKLIISKECPKKEKGYKWLILEIKNEI